MPLDRIEKKLNDHIKVDFEIHKELKDSIDTIKDNHLAHLKDDLIDVKMDLGGVKVIVGTMKTDITWIKKIQWFLITSSISILVTLLVGLVVLLLRIR